MDDKSIEALEAEPWLKPFVEDGDADLEAARARYAEGQANVTSVRTRFVKGGVRTTSYQR
jgi:hypothetical protein